MVAGRGNGRVDSYFGHIVKDGNSSSFRLDISEYADDFYRRRNAQGTANRSVMNEA
jgi:hypothetical protein